MQHVRLCYGASFDHASLKVGGNSVGLIFPCCGVLREALCLKFRHLGYMQGLGQYEAICYAACRQNCLGVVWLMQDFTISIGQDVCQGSCGYHCLHTDVHNERIVVPSSEYVCHLVHVQHV